ncbi:hypothetical protein C2W62_22905 [Candidatus Entotheonella serta]|nr:hypothetical protein C2W62_22905 [Candidatus Entotheonella serta]
MANRRRQRQFITDVIHWDMVNWSQALHYWEQSTSIDFASCQALELGAGRSGGLSLWLASHGAEVVCSALDEVPSRARATHRSYGVDAQIVYEPLDMRSIPYENAFDVMTLFTCDSQDDWPIESMM